MSKSTLVSEIQSIIKKGTKAEGSELVYAVQAPSSNNSYILKLSDQDIAIFEKNNTGQTQFKFNYKTEQLFINDMLAQSETSFGEHLNTIVGLIRQDLGTYYKTVTDDYLAQLISHASQTSESINVEVLSPEQLKQVVGGYEGIVQGNVQSKIALFERLNRQKSQQSDHTVPKKVVCQTIQANIEEVPRLIPKVIENVLINSMALARTIHEAPKAKVLDSQSPNSMGVGDVSGSEGSDNKPETQESVSLNKLESYRGLKIIEDKIEDGPELAQSITQAVQKYLDKHINPRLGKTPIVVKSVQYTLKGSEPTITSLEIVSKSDSKKVDNPNKIDPTLKTKTLQLTPEGIKGSRLEVVLKKSKSKEPFNLLMSNLKLEAKQIVTQSGRKNANTVNMLIDCMKYFLNNSDQLKTQGIFRKSVGLDLMKNTLKRVYSGESSASIFEDIKNDPHNVAVVFKQLLGNMSKPLLGDLEPDDLVQKKGEKDAEFIKRFKAKFDLLPKDNQKMVQLIFQFIYKAAQFSETSKMTVSNLGIVIAPNIVPELSLDKLATHTVPMNEGVRVLVENMTSLFT